MSGKADGGVYYNRSRVHDDAAPDDGGMNEVKSRHPLAFGCLMIVLIVIVAGVIAMAKMIGAARHGADEVEGVFDVLRDAATSSITPTTTHEVDLPPQDQIPTSEIHLPDAPHLPDLPDAPHISDMPDLPDAPHIHIPEDITLPHLG